MIARYLAHLVLWWGAVLAGPAAWWLCPRDMNVVVGRGYGRFKWGWADRIWGNEADGLSGDRGYIRDHVLVDPLAYRSAPVWGWPIVAGINTVRWLRRRYPSFWWTVVRNPANNMARHLGPNGIITSIRRGRHLAVFEVSKHGMRRNGFFFYTPDWPVMFKVGYKLWPEYKIGDHFGGAIAFSIQRGGKA